MTARRLEWGAVLLSIVALVGIIAVADRYADGDMGHLMAVEVRLAQLLRSGDIWTAMRLWWALIAPQPPIGYLPGILAYTVFGARAFVAPLTMGFVLLVGWDALRRMWGARAWMAWVGLIASPLVWLAVEQHGRDLVAGVVLLQTLAWLQTTSGFRERRAAVMFGVWLGVGFMTKYTFPIFAVAPCLVAGVGLLRAPTRARWSNLGFAVLGFLGPAGVWYALRGAAVLHYAGFSYGEEMAGNTANLRDPWALASLAYYPLSLRDALSLPGLGLVVVAVGVGLWTDRGRVGSCLAAVLGGLVVLSTVPEAIDRYALPAFLACVAMLPALDVHRLARVAVLAVFVPQAAATAHRFRPDAPVVIASYEHALSSAGALAWPAPDTYRPSDLGVDSWNLRDAVRAIRQTQGQDTGTIGVLGGRGPEAGPSFATLLLAAARVGCHYDYATINIFPAPGAPDVFVGPLFDGSFPSAAFTTLYVVRPANADGAIDRWLNTHIVKEQARFPGPKGATTIVYRVSR